MLTTNQIEDYNKNGFLLLPNLFSASEIDSMRREMKETLRENSPNKIYERNGAVRSFFVPQQSGQLFNTVARLERLVLPAMLLLESEVYVHQAKINSKSAMLGDWWEWHQDFPYWHLEDGMPTPRVLTAMIFLNMVNEFNGPMLLIPGSHKAGLVDHVSNNNELKNENEWFRNYQMSTSYMSNLTAKLKYTLRKDTLLKWVEKNGINSAKGESGSVLIFSGLVFHASNNNLSPWDRHTYLITYNSIENKLVGVRKPRPDFLANQDFTPIQPVNDNVLMQISSNYKV